VGDYFAQHWKNTFMDSELLDLWTGILKTREHVLENESVSVLR
jgi:hypothetical protein